MKRVVIRLTLIVVLVVVIGMVALKLLLPVDRLVTLAADSLREETGAEILYGDVSLDLWPRVTLVVTDVQLTGPVVELGPQGGIEFWQVKADRLSGGLALGPLLSRRAELDRLNLESPVIEIVTRPALDQAETAPASDVPPPEFPVALIAAGAEIHNGSVSWREIGGRALALGQWRQDVTVSELGQLTSLLTHWSTATSPTETNSAGHFELAGTIGSLELSDWQPGPPMQFENIAMKGRIDLPADASVISVNGLVLEWEGWRISGTGNITPPVPTGRLVLDLALERHDINRVRPILAAMLPDSLADIRTWLHETSFGIEKLDAAARLDFPVPMPENSAPGELVQGVSLDVAVVGLELTPPRLQTPWSIDGQLSLADANLRADDVVVRISGGDIQGAMTVGHVGHPSPHCSVQAELTAVPVNLLLETLVPSAAPYLDGSVDGAMTGRLRLGEPDVVRESLALAGEMVLREGAIHATEWLQGISPYLGDRQDLKDIRYQSFKHAFEVVDGRYQVRDLELRGPDTDWLGNGWVGLDGAIDLDLNVKLPSGFTPDLGSMTMFAEALRGEDERISLDLTLTGRAVRPTLGLDMSRPQGNVEQTIQQGVQGLLDKLRDRR
jgi:hypothetical protein